MKLSKQIKTVPQCIYGNPVFTVCINPQCKKPGFICQNGLSNHQECALFHQNCQKMEWSQIQRIIFQNPNTRQPQFQDLTEKMDNLFQSIIKRIQSQHYKFKIWVRTFGYSMQMMRFFKLINDGNFNSITGNYINPIIMELLEKEEPKRVEMPTMVQSQLKEVSKQLDSAFDKISELYLKTKKERTQNPGIGISYPSSGTIIQTLDSRITNDFSQINGLFEHVNIKKSTLLYRASENNFSVAAFHKLCDNHTHTLTLIQTEFGKIIGGYTPLSWNSSAKHWSQDKTMKSFIFSLNLKEKFQLNLSQFAIACNPQKGPIFGCCDICVFDQANKDKSNAQFPISYNNGKYSRGVDTYLAFTGSPKGQFLIKEWQIFKLEFY